MNDRERLLELIDVWWRAIGDFTDVLDGVDRAQWSSPTDLPGWDIHAIAAHIAHLETRMATGAESTVDVGSPDHVRSPFGLFMEAGVVARRDATPDELLDEIRTSTSLRHDRLLADPPLDGSVRPEILPPGVDWDLMTLLGNRPIDVWMHEQDVRRAVDRPGNLNSAPANHAITSLARSLPFVVAKRAAAAPGTTVGFDIGGLLFGVHVDGDGRAGPNDTDATPDLSLAMTRDVFAMAAGGRRLVTLDEVTCQGDRELATRILERMAVTP